MANTAPTPRQFDDVFTNIATWSYTVTNADSAAFIQIPIPTSVRSSLPLTKDSDMQLYFAVLSCNVFDAAGDVLTDTAPTCSGGTVAGINTYFGVYGTFPAGAYTIVTTVARVHPRFTSGKEAY